MEKKKSNNLVYLIGTITFLFLAIMFVICISEDGFISPKKYSYVSVEKSVSCDNGIIKKCKIKYYDNYRSSCNIEGYFLNPNKDNVTVYYDKLYDCSLHKYSINFFPYGLPFVLWLFTTIVVIIIFVKMVPLLQNMADNVGKPKKPAEPTNYFGKKVLILDNDSSYERLEMILSVVYEIKVDVACNGKECIKKAKENNYDLIFMDQYLPKPDIKADNVLLELKKLDKTILPPVILLASITTEEYLNEIMEDGFADYIKYPIETEDVYRILKKYLKK